MREGSRVRQGGLWRGSGMEERMDGLQEQEEEGSN